MSQFPDNWLVQPEQVVAPNESAADAAKLSRAESRLEWQKSSENKLLRREGIVLLFILVVLIYISAKRIAPWIAKDKFATCCPADVNDSAWAEAWLVVGAGLAAVSVALFAVWRIRNGVYQGLFGDRREVEAQQASLQKREASQSTSDESPTLVSLWNLTQERLDYYHNLATTQAEKSFARAQTAMFIGFVLVIILVWFSVTAKTTSGSIAAGSLGALVGSATAYISGTFIRSQEDAASHLRSYFLQPLEFSRFLAAERIAMKVQGETQAQTLASVAIAVATGGAKLDMDATKRNE